MSCGSMKPILEESCMTTPDLTEEQLRNKSGAETPLRGSTESDSANAVTPPYVKWAIGFDSLLEDPEGQKVFQSYLRAEGALNNLMFWYAVNGFKTQSDRHKKYRLATVIGRTFLKRNSANALSEIGSDNRKQILDAIRKNHAENDVFDRAQSEIECFLKEKAYPMFLKSDVYIDYCNKAVHQQTTAMNNLNVSSNSPLNTTSGQIGSLNNDCSPTSSTYSNQSTVTPTVDPPKSYPPGYPGPNIAQPNRQAPSIPGDKFSDNLSEKCHQSSSVGAIKTSSNVPLESHSLDSGSVVENAQSGLPAQSSKTETGLATVHEDTELLCKEINLRGGNKGFEATSDTFAASTSPTCRKKCHEVEGCQACHYSQSNNSVPVCCRSHHSHHGSGSNIGVNERRSDKAAHMYTNFVPTGSANDSEIQSLSSDTHTDDSASLADPSLDTSSLFPLSSVSGGGVGGIGGVGVGGVSSGGLIPGGGHSSSSMRKSLQKHVSKRDRRYMNYAAEKNGSHSRMFPLHAQFGRPTHYSSGGGGGNGNRGGLTQQAVSEQNLSVHEFAALLIQKLEIAKQERERMDKYAAHGYHAQDSVDLNSTSASSSDGLAVISKSKHSNMCGTSNASGSGPGTNSANNMGISYIKSSTAPQLQMSTSGSAPGIDREDPESIIDNHMSRVFCDSTQSPVNPRSKTPDRYATMHTHKCSSCGQSTLSQTLPNNYRNNQLPMQQQQQQGLNMGSNVPGYNLPPPSRYNKQMLVSHDMGVTGQGGGGNAAYYNQKMRSSMGAAGGAHRKIMAESSSSKSTSSGVDSGVYDAQSLGSTDSYGGKHAMVTQWVETHRQTHGSSHHNSHHQVTKPEMNLAVTTANSIEPNATLSQGMPGSGGGSSRRMGGASRSSAGSQNRHRWASVSPSPLTSARLSLSTAGPQQVGFGSGGTIACSNQPLSLFNPTSGTLPGNPHQINQHYSLASASNTLPPGASGMTSSHRRSPVSNAPLASTSGQNPNIAQNPNISQNTGTSSLNSSGVSQSGHQGSGSVVGSGNISSQTAAPGVQTVVAYYFCNETIPYRTTVPHKDVTLGQFKALLTRRGRFRYFFKMRSNDIELGGVVQQEITDDDDILPMFDGKIIGKIEKQ